MANREELRKVVEMHKRITKSASVNLHRRQGRIRVSSSGLNDVVLRSAIASIGDDFEGTIDSAAFLAFLRGAGEIKMGIKEGRLFVRGSKVRGDIPVISGEIPTIPRLVDALQMPASDVAWLVDALSCVAISDLDRTGLLSAECDGREWRLSCIDDVHGACTFGTGKTKIAFSLIPGEAEFIRVILDEAGEGKVVIATTNNKIVVSSGIHTVAVSTIDGSAQTRDKLTDGVMVIAKADADALRDAIAVLGPIASAKDAKPVTIKTGADGISLLVSSPVGSVSNHLDAVCRRDVEFRVSYALLTAIAARAIGKTTFGILTENKEITRLSLVCEISEGNLLYLVMLTST